MVFPSLLFPQKHSKPCTTYSMPLSSYLCGWLERKIGGTKGASWGLIKEKSGNNNEVRKWTVTAIILRVHTEEVNGSQVTAHHTEPGNV